MRFHLNFRLLLAQVMLLTLGLVGVAAAEPDWALNHGIKALAALGITVAVAQLRPQWLMRLGLGAWLSALALLVLVLIIGEGASHSTGTKRWLNFGGPFRFQPSEFAKLGLVLQLSSFFARRGVNSKLVSAIGMILFTTLLILVEPDLGTSVMTFVLGIVVMYSAGVRFTTIALVLSGLGLASLPLANIYLQSHPYIAERWLGHTQREENLSVGLDQIGKAHRDLSNGGVWGLGPDAPRFENFAWETDLIISSIGFSVGLIGVLGVLFAYWLVVHESLSIAQKASRVRPMTPAIHGAAILAVGCMFLIVGQAALNLLVAAGILPTTGITLPFVSYGFSSMLVMSVALGIIHAAEAEVRRAVVGAQQAESEQSERLEPLHDTEHRPRAFVAAPVTSPPQSSEA